MALDLDAIWRGVRDVVEDVIGPDLTQVSGKAAIVRARNSGTRPKLPYTTIDILSIRDANSYLTNLTLNEEGQDIYETHKEIPISIAVRAAEQKSYNIAQKLHKSFTFISVQDDLKNNINCTITSVEPILSIPEVLSTRLQEFCTFNLILRTSDVDVDTNSFPIENVETVGNIEDAAGNPVDTVSNPPPP
jgi:hypothetical protein